jgi:NAD(P)-dependent dehydrogenase (short-subunit alcohol dehydrogenase family)
MDLQLAGSTVLITGGSKGIGAATARAFAAEGARLVLVARSLDGLERVRDSIRAEHPVDIDLHACDLSIGERVVELAARFREVDVLVNNAGAVPGGGLLDVSEAAWRAGWDTKVFAYVNMCRAFWPVLEARGGGVIVNVLGAGSLQKRADYLCGGMGNAALDFLTETLGAAGPAHGIRVVGVSPGAVDTDRLRAIYAPRILAGLDPYAGMPFERTATPHEIGAAITFLASPRSSYTSGAILVVDGGYSVPKGAVPARDAR